MSDKASSYTAHAIGTVIAFIAISFKLCWQFFRYFLVIDRIILDSMVRIVQLRHIDCIGTIHAVCHIDNLIVAIIEASICQDDLISIFGGDSHATVIDGCISHSDRTIFCQVDFLSQLDF